MGPVTRRKIISHSSWFTRRPILDVGLADYEFKAFGELRLALRDPLSFSKCLAWYAAKFKTYPERFHFSLFPPFHLINFYGSHQIQLNRPLSVLRYLNHWKRRMSAPLSSPLVITWQHSPTQALPFSARPTACPHQLSRGQKMAWKSPVGAGTKFRMMVHWWSVKLMETIMLNTRVPRAMSLVILVPQASCKLLVRILRLTKVSWVDTVRIDDCQKRPKNYRIQ